MPGFLCRVGGCYFLIRWWHNRKTRDGFLGAFALGLGFFSKIDFVVILFGCGIALAVAYRKEVLASIRNSPNKCAFCCLGFLLGASPMAIKIPAMLAALFGNGNPEGGPEWLEKINIACTMYDGSYFYRLMNVGGKFETMFTHSCSSWSPFGVVVIFSAILLAVYILQGSGKTAEKRRLAFLLLSAVLITAGVFLLPGASRLHHHLAVYPFPHLLVAAVIIMLWEKTPANVVGKWSIRMCAVGLAVVVIVAHLLVIRQTQGLIEATGGRGHWSDSIEEFCNDVKDQRGLSIVSLDWGFNEQLLYLCNNKRLLEPIWCSQSVPASSKYVYLVHPPEYTVFPAGLEYYRALKRAYPHTISIRPYKDREGNVAFYAVRLLH